MGWDWASCWSEASWTERLREEKADVHNSRCQRVQNRSYEVLKLNSDWSPAFSYFYPILVYYDSIKS